jgi:hypothetical protein
MMLPVQSQPQRHRSGEAAPDEIDPRSHPLALRLVSPERDYVTIGPDHALYQLALLAWRDRYRRPARAQEVAAGLDQAEWPRAPGPQSDKAHKALTATALADDGLDTGDVAHALRVQLDTARRLVKRGRELQQLDPELQRVGSDFAPYVEAVGTATQPAALTLARSWARPEHAESRARLNGLRTGERERL